MKVRDIPHIIMGVCIAEEDFMAWGHQSSPAGLPHEEGNTFLSGFTDLFGIYVMQLNLILTDTTDILQVQWQEMYII